MVRSFLSKLSTIDEKTLTSRELLIVDYIKANIKKIVSENMRIETLAIEVGTGFSAIYGLLSKLNIKGYRDFFISLSNDVDNAKINMSSDDENVANGYIANIKQNYTLIDKKSLEESLKIIKSGKRIFVVYWESILRGPAQELENFFFEHGINVSLLDSDWDRIKQRADSVSDSDVFIFFSKYGASKHLESIVEEINKKNGKVIFVSGRVPSKKITETASITHTLIIDSFDEKNEFVSKSMPFLYFKDLIVFYFLNGSKK